MKRSPLIALAASALFVIAAAPSCSAILDLGSFKDCCKPIGVGEPPDCVYCGKDGGGQGGAAAECDQPSDCPETDSVCKTRTCSDHQCGVAAVPKGTPIAKQTAADCKEVECDGSGSTQTVDKDSDFKDDMNQCTTDACKSGVTIHTDKPARTACTDDGGKFCDGKGACVACTEGTDCPSTICQVGKCVDASCTDGTKNNDETDIDCGGSCGPCADGKMCGKPADCQGGACNGGICCTPTTCAALGATCGSQPDGCGGMLDCDDGAKNGTETDVDCGGASCKPCAQGGACTGNADCANARCIDGFCCDTTCTTVCYSCNVTGSEGTCTPVKNDTKDKPNCDQDSGGNLACNGAGVCVGGAGHLCTMPSQCASGVCTGAVQKACGR